MSLSYNQSIALERLSEKPGSAYSMKISLQTLNSLHSRGFIRRETEIGVLSFPHNAMWLITQQGKNALQDERDRENDYA